MKLDYIDHLTVSDEVAQKHGNEIRTLSYLAKGLRYLYGQVAGTERQVRERFGEQVKVFTMGNDPAMAGVPLDLIACSFHWYAVSACNYVWLVGWLAQQADASRAAPRQYAEDVIPRIVRYRHKVGAHLAKVFPKKGQDTAATLEASVIYPVTFEDDAFYAGGLRVSVRRQGEASRSIPLRWSLTKRHRDLIPRYWPDQQERKPPGNEAPEK